MEYPQETGNDEIWGPVNRWRFRSKRFMGQKSTFFWASVLEIVVCSDDMCVSQLIHAFLMPV